MSVDAWNIDRWKELFEIGGTACAIAFTGIALRIDARVRRAETLIEITKQHRELWLHYDETPALHGLFELGRDMAARPLANDEVHFVNFVLNHLRATYYAKSAGIYVQPECLREDIRDFLSHPAPRAAWELAKPFQDAKFKAFVEANAAPINRKKR